LYDLDADPEEKTDLHATDSGLARRLMAELDDRIREMDRPFA